mgnify:CR=1 FL=1
MAGENKGGNKKLTKKDMYNKKILDKMSDKQIMSNLVRLGLVDPKKQGFKMGGMATKKKELTGVFSMKGISNSTSYLNKLKEEASVRIHNKQSIIYVFILSLLNTLNYIYNKFIKL